MNYFLRKNCIYFEDWYYHRGKGTQIINSYTNFTEAKKEYLRLSKKIINIIFEEGFGIYGNTAQEQHKLLLYAMVLKKNISLKSIGEKPSDTIRDLIKDSNFIMKLNSDEEVELLDMLYPTNSHEIIFTNNDFLLSPSWNPIYFENSNEKIPMTIPDYEEVFTPNFLTVGLYTDKLDYWVNIEKDINCFGYLTSIFNQTKAYQELIEKDNSVKQFFTERNGKYQLKNPSSFIFWTLSQKMNEPPILFKEIKINKLREFEKKQYESLVIKSYLAGTHYYSHQEIMNNAKHNFWFNLSITENFAKEIINDNIEHVNELAKELKEKY